MITELRPGDVLSYSAGSTQTGPYGFRKLRARAAEPLPTGSRGPMLDVAVQLWPDLLEVLGDGTILFINAYPAAVGSFPFGVSVDTYLSPRVSSRALQLGRVGEHSTILLGQPLYVADALWHHVAAGRPLPKTLMIWVGGYAMPASLERWLQNLLEPHVERLEILQYFGAAEVDAGCLVARHRCLEGEPVYIPRPDVRPEISNGHLLLSLTGSNGQPTVERFPTGDLARRCGEGWVIRNPERLHPEVEQCLESWSDDDWRRRTGYVRRDGQRIWIQLREREASLVPEEIGFFPYASRFGFSWLDKPSWR